MAVDETLKNYVEEQLELFGEYSTRKMFGGLGFFKENVMFGAIMHGAFRLKGDATTEEQFAKFGKGRHKIPGKKMSMPYFEVPEEILADKAVLREWAFQAWEVALKTKKR